MSYFTCLLRPHLWGSYQMSESPEWCPNDLLLYISMCRRCGKQRCVFYRLPPPLVAQLLLER